MLGLSALIAYCLNNSEIQCQECNLTFNSEEELKHHINYKCYEQMNEQDLSQPHKIQIDLKMSKSESSCQKCDQKLDITVQDQIISQDQLWHPHLVLCQECDKKCQEM